MQLPNSVLTKSQTKQFRKGITHDRIPATIVATVRHDDQCGNGHNTFSITGEIRQGGIDVMGGCIHEEIAKHFPELAPFIKWHLVSTDGPIHMIANTIYHAGDRDCWGLRKGEKRQIVNGRTKQPHWDLVAVMLDGSTKQLYEVNKDFNGAIEDAPPVPVLRWEPCCRIGEGKERDLDAARSTAVWPEATDEQLMQEPDALKAALEARLPALMLEFKAAVETLGFVY